MADDIEDSPDDTSIGDDELLLRRVHPDLVHDSKPERNIFKDDRGGLGTSLTVWRTQADLDAVMAGQPHVGVVSITAGEIRKHSLRLVFTFEEGNPMHCEAIGKRDRKQLGAMRDACVWVVPMPG